MIDRTSSIIESLLSPERRMKSRLALLVFVAASILPVPALAASYYYDVTGTAGGRSTATFGPFPSLSECQEALAKMVGRGLRKDQNATTCYAK
jgi:hypothetical protein